MTENLIGSSLFVASAVPATNDAAGFEALSWTKIEGLQTAPVFGVTHATTNIPDLQSGFTKSVKGSASGSDTQLTVRFVESDAGQAAVETLANDAQGVCSLKLVKRGSGAANAPAAGDAVEYAHGFLHSYQDNQATDTNHEGASANFRQNDFTVKATEPTP